MAVCRVVRLQFFLSVNDLSLSGKNKSFFFSIFLLLTDDLAQLIRPKPYRHVHSTLMIGYAIALPLRSLKPFFSRNLPFADKSKYMKRQRIMVVGSNVMTVQRVSSHCLKQNAEVFPYYCIPTPDEIALFEPHVLVLCLPIPEQFQQQLLQPYILWSEKLVNGISPLATTLTELSDYLHKFL
ncbi:hypothetical protein [Nostoc sp. DSM 114167]|jgi:hypothetical protein|uniref:hypothetical protein n=1 Tax=Nostoc sp. DSM 114167 TaxID=3439050 RepID=UPI0040458E46